MLGGDMANLDNALAKVNELKEDLDKLESKYPLTDRTELNAFVDTVEAWEVEAEKIVNVARGNTEESRTQAAALIASDCSPGFRMRPTRATPWPRSSRMSRTRSLTSSP